MSRIATWLTTLLQDPDLSPSTTRVCGVLAILTACGCAVAGVVRRDPNAAAIVAAIGGVGSACLFARKRSDSPNGQGS